MTMPMAEGLVEGSVPDMDFMLADFCKDRLAKYKWPEEVEFREVLPKSTVGKILRKDLRAEELAKRG